MTRLSDKVYNGNGAFGEYIIVKSNLQLEIPESISFEEAATLGVAVTTIVSSISIRTYIRVSKLMSQEQALYKVTPSAISGPAACRYSSNDLIHAASTATGMMGIQFAKASGLTVIANPSPHNFDELRVLGADRVFNYKSPGCAAAIRQGTGNKLKYA